MGGAVSAGEDNEELVDNLVKANYIRTEEVENIFRLIDRGFYYLDQSRKDAYRDTAWKYKHLHLSAPCIYAEAIEALELGPGMDFLNLGSGTGYLSTMAGFMLNGTGSNDGVELHQDVVDYAESKVNQFISADPAIYMQAWTRPTFTVGNCLMLDVLTTARYDRVYCGAAVPSEYQSLIHSLVKVGGIVVMPFEEQLQQVKRVTEKSVESKNILPVSFALMIEPTENDRIKNASYPIFPEKQIDSLQQLAAFTVRQVLRRCITEENELLKTRCVHVEKETADGETRLYQQSVVVQPIEPVPTAEERLRAIPNNGQAADDPDAEQFQHNLAHAVLQMVEEHEAEYPEMEIIVHNEPEQSDNDSSDDDVIPELTTASEDEEEPEHELDDDDEQPSRSNNKRTRHVTQSDDSVKKQKDEAADGNDGDEKESYATNNEPEEVQTSSDSDSDQPNADTDYEEGIQSENDEMVQDIQTALSAIVGDRGNHRRRLARFIRTRGRTHSISSEQEEDKESKEKARAERNKTKENIIEFGELMQKRISQLPIPERLRVFVNFDKTLDDVLPDLMDDL